jgi:hypothetical protein
MDMPETTERFIAYFDIMGFKDLVYRSEHSDIAEIMNHVCTDVEILKKWGEKEHLKGGKGIEKGIILPVMFSDSVVFISKGNTVTDARTTAFTAGFFLYCMLTAGVPIKGSLAYGLFTANFKKSSFFGRPLVDAYLLAEDMHFYGAVLHHSFEKFLHDNKEKLPPSILTSSVVPVKGGSVTHSYIGWQFLLKKGQTTESVIEPFYRTVSGSTRRYVDNTKSVYQKTTMP